MAMRARRTFLRDVGAGMLAAGLGSGLPRELGLSLAFADDGPERLNFGPLEGLASLLQETPVDRLLPLLVERLRGGTELRDLVAAAALANARCFGGEDYVGFHTMMAMAPAFHMAGEASPQDRALPILKVLYRNTQRIHQRGGPEVLQVASPGPRPEENAGLALRAHTRRSQVNEAERLLASLRTDTPDDILNAVLVPVEDATDVHRVALPYRAWDLCGIIGREHAYTLLRQSVRYCARTENPRYAERLGRFRTLVEQQLDRHRLLSRPLGNRPADEAWVEGMSRTLFRSSPEQAAEAVAAGLAEGMSPDAIGEALALTANQLLLRDRGRTAGQAQPNKPEGSVHGDSIGLHSSDAVNAWRNLARVAGNRNRIVCLIVAGYQVAQDRVNGSSRFAEWEPYPSAAALERVPMREEGALLGALEEAIRGRDQVRAAAVAARYGNLSLPARPIFDLLRRHSITADGALHAEKYYRTATEEFASLRPAFRWRQVISLARVCASAYGYEAPGLAEATRLLRA